MARAARAALADSRALEEESFRETMHGGAFIGAGGFPSKSESYGELNREVKERQRQRDTERQQKRARERVVKRFYKEEVDRMIAENRPMDEAAFKEIVDMIAEETKVPRAKVVELCKEAEDEMNPMDFEDFEEQGETKGSGATPSMGLSQFRGGRGKCPICKFSNCQCCSSDEEMNGGAGFGSFLTGVASAVRGSTTAARTAAAAAAARAAQAVAAARAAMGARVPSAALNVRPPTSTALTLRPPTALTTFRPPPPPTALTVRPPTSTALIGTRFSNPSLSPAEYAAMMRNARNVRAPPASIASRLAAMRVTPAMIAAALAAGVAVTGLVDYFAGQQQQYGDGGYYDDIIVDPPPPPPGGPLVVDVAPPQPPPGGTTGRPGRGNRSLPGGMTEGEYEWVLKTGNLPDRFYTMSATELRKAVRGSGKKAASGRAAVVKQVMAEQGLSLPAASKYVKDNNLWSK